MTSYVLAIEIVALFLTVCDMTTFNVPTMSRFESLTFTKSVKVMSYDVAQYVVGRLFFVA